MSTRDEPSPAAAPPGAPPHLRPARLDDHPEIVRLEASHGLASLPPDGWRHLWLDNPLWPRLGQSWPVGWVLEGAGGRLVGTLSNIPSLYAFRGRELTCANGKSWVVEPEYRGVALWLFSEYFAQEGVDLFVNTTVGAFAAPTFEKLSARIPSGDWQAAAYRVTGYRGFARSALRIKGVPLAGPLAYPAAAALRLRGALTARPLPAAPPSVEIAQPAGFDARFDGFWAELVRQNPDKLLGVRDSRTLSWHYALPLRAGQLWVFTAVRDGLLRAWCVLKRQWMPQDMRCMRLVDYQTIDPETDHLPGLLRAALRRCGAEGIHVLEHLGCGLPKMRAFDQFAPRSRRLRAWPFYYQAPDPALDADLRRPETWDPSPYDGDASIA